MRLSTSLALAALTTNALSLNIHRDVHKREESPAPCTTWETVTQVATVYGGTRETSTPSAQPPANAAAQADKPTYRIAQNAAAAPAKSKANPKSKRGIAYNSADLVNALIKQGVSASWAYNWDSTDNGLSSSLEFVPMLWSDRQDHASRWASNVEKMLDNGSTHILSFNEPDHAEQANMSPQAAVAAHIKYLGPYADRAKIGSPAVTNSGNDGQGVKWLRPFMKACDADSDCHVDFCVAHWYADHNVEGSLKAHLEEVRDICGDRPVWLTEFAPEGGSEGDYVKWIQREVASLDELDWVERYAYFMVGEPGRLTNGQSLNAQGAAYFQTS